MNSDNKHLYFQCMHPVPLIYSPVCGNDGFDYANHFLAECDGTGPGVNYEGHCHRLLSDSKPNIIHYHYHW